MDIDSEGNYDDTNRAFLQALMSRGQVTLKESKEILAAIFTVQSNQETTAADMTQEDVNSYISAAAHALSPLDYEIRTTFHQVSKERVYAVVNSISDALTQMATARTSEEMFYIKRLLDAMFETYNTPRREVMAVRSMQALERRVLKGEAAAAAMGSRRESGEAAAAAAANSSDKGLTVEQGEKLLETLVREKWLEKSREGFYRLSPRALMELRGWLIEAYNEETDDPDEWQRIKFCEACREIVTIGERCMNEECNVRLHNICEVAYWNSRPSKHCPKCETEWKGEKVVGEMVVTATEAYMRGKRRSGIAPKRGREVDEDQEEGESGMNGTRKKTNGVQSNGSRRRRDSPQESEEEQEQADEDDDDDE